MIYRRDGIGNDGRGKQGEEEAEEEEEEAAEEEGKMGVKLRIPRRRPLPRQWEGARAEDGVAPSRTRRGQDCMRAAASRLALAAPAL